MRNFNNKEIELLSPAGNISILGDLIKMPCDAFYVGGKMFNMRMHRSNFNFSDKELQEAIALCHIEGKKIYVTVNNLMTDTEVSSSLDFLYFLEELQPDGIIIQDLSIINLINKHNINLTMHSSVMMNVHNENMVKELYALGITRAVVSREIDLSQILRWSLSTPMEFEYFIHGDMCSVHGSQCYYSNMIFGKSSNRGMCMKPCRWHYKMKLKGKEHNTSYPLAVKDMYMYENIPELINAGVSSFKIEGRMRESDYIKKLLIAYGDSIDRYLEDPIYYDRTKNSAELYENRMRDFSTSYAFGKPQLDFNNHRYEGTGYFYSTGKVFSKPLEEHSITNEKISSFKSIRDNNNDKSRVPLVSVKIDTLEQLQISINNSVDIIYINSENFIKEHHLSIKAITELAKVKGNSRLVISLPKITEDYTFERYDFLLSNPEYLSAIDGIMVSNIGALHRYKDIGIPFYGDITLNIYNNTSKEVYKEYGLLNTPLSIELKQRELIEFTKNNDDSGLEIVVHGSPSIMYMDLDIHLNAVNSTILRDKDNQYFNNETLTIIDENGHEHPVYRDNMGKNHMMLYKDICLMPIIKELIFMGINIFRLEISHYSCGDFENILVKYKEAINNPEYASQVYNTLEPNHMGFSLGSLNF